MKKYLKRILSIICMVSIVVTSLFIVPEAKAETSNGLDRITLSDMGFPGVETTHTATASQRNVVGSFIGKEIVFYATIANDRYFSFGKGGEIYEGFVVRHQAAGVVSNTGECFKFYHSDSSSEYQTYTATQHFGAGTDKKFENQKLLFKITIEYDEASQDNIVVNFYIDNKHAVEMTMASTSLGNDRFTFAANNTANITTEDFVEKTDSGLEKLTLSDMGFSGEETIHAGVASEDTKRGIVGSFVGKEIAFYATFGYNRYFSFGKGSEIYEGVVARLQANGTDIHFYHSDSSTEYVVYSSTTHYGTSDKKFEGQKLLFNITIEYEDESQDNVVINFYIDNKHAAEMKMAASKLANDRFSFGATSTYTVTSEDFAWPEQPEEELEPSPENLVPITWTNFGITATKIYLKSMGDEAGLSGHMIQDADTLNTLVGTSFRGKVSFNRQEGNLIICYGAQTTGGYDGIRIYPNIENGTLTFQGMGGDNPILATLDPAKTELTSGTFMNTEFELGIDLWESDGDIKMNIFIEGVQYNRGAYVWADAATNGYVKKANNFVVGNEKNSLTVILPEPEYEASPEGLKKINWEDFGVTNENLSFTSENKTNDDGRHIIEMTEMQSVMETSFRGIITLDRNGSEAYYLCYGSEGANWSGIRMSLTNGNLKVECVGINKESSPTQKTFESIAAVNTGLTSFTDVPFELGIDIWEDGEDVKFNLFFNGKQYNAQAYVWEGVAEKEYFSSRINMIVKDEADAMRLALAEKVGCDIEATPAGYLLSGDTVRVDDILVTDNKTLTAKGDYHVLYVNENGAFARDISCYIPGDAHPDDEIDVRDLVATIKASQGYKLTTGVATWSADVNKDLSVDTIDSYLVRNKILAAPAASTVAAYSLIEDKSVMPIGGFSGPYGSLVSDKADEIYSLIRESGVNFLTFLPSVYDATSGVGDQSVFKQLELAEKNNLSVFVTDHDIVTSGTSWDAQKLSNRIRVLSKYKSFKGLSIVDEPRTNEYGKSDSRSYMSNYADASRSINMYANLSAYISAYPLRKNLIIDNNSSQEYTTVYENYLKEYCENFNPKYLSYDHYPFESGTNAITGEAIDTDEKGRYFENLAIIRKVANEENIPFWTMIQTGNYFGKEQIYSSDCGTTEGQFKWQVNVELAFGAKGIQYFPLVQPEGWEVSQSWLGFSTDENYKRHGFINAKGETTEMYTWAQEINTQIKAIDHVLMNSKSEGVMVTGKYATENMANLDKLEMPILTSYNNVVTGIATTGTQYGAIAGCFDYYGKTVLYVVNYDVKNPQTITLQFNGKQNATKITPDGKSSTVGGTTCEINLNAGEGTLLIF